MFNKTNKIVSYGINIIINVAITINGPKAIYSSIFLILVIINNILSIAPIKNESKAIIIIFVRPKYSPKAPISFTSP